MRTMKDWTRIAFMFGGAALLLTFAPALPLHGGEAPAQTPAITPVAGGLDAVFEAEGTRWNAFRFAPPRFVDNQVGKGYEFDSQTTKMTSRYAAYFNDTADPTAEASRPRGWHAPVVGMEARFPYPCGDASGNCLTTPRAEAGYIEVGRPKIRPK